MHTSQHCLVCRSLAAPAQPNSQPITRWRTANSQPAARWWIANSQPFTRWWTANSQPVTRWWTATASCLLGGRLIMNCTLRSHSTTQLSHSPIRRLYRAQLELAFALISAVCAKEELRDHPQTTSRHTHSNHGVRDCAGGRGCPP